ERSRDQARRRGDAGPSDVRPSPPAPDRRAHAPARPARPPSRPGIGTSSPPALTGGDPRGGRLGLSLSSGPERRIAGLELLDQRVFLLLRDLLVGDSLVELRLHGIAHRGLEVAFADALLGRDLAQGLALLQVGLQFIRAAAQ